MPVFVLVHGTGHGGWCWQKVVRILRAEGFDAFARTLTGVSDRSHLLECGVDLTTHITDVSNLLFYEDLTDVVLVGHSYGGMVVSGVAATAPERLRQIIYLDAYVPDEGQSEVDLWPPGMRAEIEADAQASGGLRSPPSPEVMGIDDPELVEWVQQRITPHPVATYMEAVPEGSAQSAALPRAYIRCTEGPLTSVFDPFAQKARAEGWPIREIATGHNAMLTAPEEVVELLLDLVRGVGKG